MAAAIYCLHESSSPYMFGDETRMYAPLFEYIDGMVNVTPPTVRGLPPTTVIPVWRWKACVLAVAGTDSLAPMPISVPPLISRRLVGLKAVALSAEAATRILPPSMMMLPSAFMPFALVSFEPYSNGLPVVTTVRLPPLTVKSVSADIPLPPLP